jgi:hypothetical protein
MGGDPLHDIHDHTTHNKTHFTDASPPEGEEAWYESQHTRHYPNVGHVGAFDAKLCQMADGHGMGVHVQHDGKGGAFVTTENQDSAPDYDPDTDPRGEQMHHERHVDFHNELSEFQAKPVEQQWAEMDQEPWVHFNDNVEGADTYPPLHEPHKYWDAPFE